MTTSFFIFPSSTVELTPVDFSRSFLNGITERRRKKDYVFFSAKRIEKSDDTTIFAARHIKQNPQRKATRRTLKIQRKEASIWTLTIVPTILVCAM